MYKNRMYTPIYALLYAEYMPYYISFHSIFHYPYIRVSSGGPGTTHGVANGAGQVPPTFKGYQGRHVCSAGGLRLVGLRALVGLRFRLRLDFFSSMFLGACRARALAVITPSGTLGLKA